MIILTVMLVAVFALLFGFLVGICYQGKPTVKSVKANKEPSEAEFQKEYENFLNYDGTAQE